MNWAATPFLQWRVWAFALIVAAVLAPNLAGVCPEAYAGRRTVRIVGVKDGDTVVTADKAIVRLAGIDAPEMRPRKSPQPFAREAKARLEDLVKRRKVEIELAEETRDRYGRILAYIHLKGRLINQEMVEEGLARVFIIGPNTRYASDLIQAERRARRSQKGLWGKWKGQWGR